MTNPPVLLPPGESDKSIFRMSPEEIRIRKKVDEVASEFQSFLGWSLYPPIDAPVIAHFSNRLRRAELASEDSFEDAIGYIHTTSKFLEDMATINAYDEELFEEFVEEFETMEFDRYYGIREELATARSLVIKGIGFVHPDPPDFVFQYKGANLKIECTSNHINSSNNLMQKICNTIDGKDSKPYSGSETILMMNITNLIHKIVGNKQKPDLMSLKARIRSDAELFDWSFGSIILICYLTNPDSQKYERIYVRCDTENLGNDLESFLELHYPEEGKSLEEFRILGES